MTDDDPKIERSPLCREVSQDGITVQVQIYRVADGNHEWSLEVVDPDSNSTVWSETFKTDQAAYDEFQRALEAEGMASLLEERIQSLCLDRGEILFVVTVMPDENICRIISARKATRHEQEQYFQGGSLFS